MADPPMKLIMASRDPVALDTVGSLVMGYDPTTIPYLDWAAGAGLRTNDLRQESLGGRVAMQHAILRAFLIINDELHSDTGTARPGSVRQIGAVTHHISRIAVITHSSCSTRRR